MPTRYALFEVETGRPLGSLRLVDDQAPGEVFALFRRGDVRLETIDSAPDEIDPAAAETDVVPLPIGEGDGANRLTRGRRRR